MSTAIVTAGKSNQVAVVAASGGHGQSATGRNINTAGSVRRRGSAAPIPPPALLCNLCQKPLTTTCFLCACDCVFCEECTYSHFERSSNCPTCSRVLSEQDFTELVVADASNTASTDIVKTSLQALFSKHSKSSANAAGIVNKSLPFSDLCYSLIKQIDVVKQSTKFILKQLLMESSGANRRYHNLHRSYEAVKNDMTQVKQNHSSQRLQLEQINNDLQNRLKAREQANNDLLKKIKDQERMLDQFRRIHSNGMAVSSAADGGNGNRASSAMPGGGGRGGSMMMPAPLSQQLQHQQQPPLQGLIMQKEAQKQQMQQSYAMQRQPAILGSSRNRMSSQGHITSTMITDNSMNGNANQGGNHGLMTMRGMSASGGAGMSILHPQHHHHQNQTQPMSTMQRPYSTNSIGSLPSTPRIRDLSSSSGYNFTGSSSSLNASNDGTSNAAGGGYYHINKRRRGGSSTPLAGMSPSTAFALNQGPHTVAGGPRWMNNHRQP